ncbi:MAG: transglutaminase-like domain-containing protein [Bacteroidota bacterium]|jgi:regulator of sirC expression with transglutaminase-like and TPR domain
MESNKINALVSLLDDPDYEVFSEIKTQLLTLGIEAIPFLENAWETSFDTTLQKRAEEIIHDIQYNSVSNELENWIKNGGVDLIEGIAAVARYQYPDLKTETIKQQLNEIKNDIWLELNHNLTALEIVRVVNHIIFDVHGFTGNTTNFHAPQNSFINIVMETKKGNPLMLSILYIYLAEQLDLPIFGVNLPEHFVLAYTDNEQKKSDWKNADVLFYINPFSKGTVFSKKDIDQFLKQIKLEHNDSYYKPCDNVNMLVRLLRNLSNSFDKIAYPQKAKEINNLLIKLLKNNK